MELLEEVGCDLFAAVSGEVAGLEVGYVHLRRPLIQLLHMSRQRELAAEVLTEYSVARRLRQPPGNLAFYCLLVVNIGEEVAGSLWRRLSNIVV